MKYNHLGAVAKVSLTVEVSTSTWGGLCTVEQVYKQAEEEAINKINKIIADSGAKIIGNPQVTISIGYFRKEPD